jgi:SAM-dependent methyltransferase
LPAAILRRLLAHPLTAGLLVDDPANTELRRKIIASKPFLRAIYDEWYGMLANALPQMDGKVLELGSGAGYCARFIPGLITSEVFLCSNAQIVLDARRLPFADRSLRAIVMTDVLHHIPDVRLFFREARRCLRSRGRILMIEPWVTSWSRFVYRRFHHEPVDPEAKDWAFPSAGPLSGANSALPWIVFVRDREQFAAEFPEFCIESIRPFLPFRYVLSGGVSLRTLMPAFTSRAWTGLERLLEPQMNRLAMFAFISLKKI